jgi:hypothetical protein
MFVALTFTLGRYGLVPFRFLRCWFRFGKNRPLQIVPELKMLLLAFFLSNGKTIN